MTGRKWLQAAGLAALALACSPALACSDFGIPKAWSLRQTDIENNMPFLAPSNDSRTTMLLLLSDAGFTRPHLPAPLYPEEKVGAYWAEAPMDFDTLSRVLGDRPAATDETFVSGEGDLCRSNAAASDGYLAALDASSVPQGEKTVLATARKALGGACNTDAKTTATLPAGAIKSAQGKEFAAYLTAAAAFYAEDFTAARFGITGLMQSSQPWLREASRYMVARVDLNAAQAAGFDEYGWLTTEKVDASYLGKADSEFRAYLKDYPRGTYANSARGLLRRVAWLSGDKTRLAAALEEAFAQADPKQRNVSVLDLVYEADNKVLTQMQPADIHEPRLLAAIDLMRMRRDGEHPAPLTRAELEAQRPFFKSQAALYDYLLAAYAFYDDDNPAAALKIVGGAVPAANMSSVTFSQLVLKGLALEAVHKRAEARAHWLSLVAVAEPILQRPAVELALAQNYEHSGELGAIFAKDSAVRSPTYRAIVLNNSAGPDLLRQRAEAADAPNRERRVALEVLLTKELTRGRYKAFLDDLGLLAAVPAPSEAEIPSGSGWDFPVPLDDFNWAGVKDGFACPSIRSIATTLAQNPRAERSLLCLGEFMRIHPSDGDEVPPAPTLDKAAPAAELGTLASQFPGQNISRLAIYKAIIKNPKAEHDVRAFALYRAINCWAPSGANSCGGGDAPQSERKKWFGMLKAQYRDTVWAGKLKYYW